MDRAPLGRGRQRSAGARARRGRARALRPRVCALTVGQPRRCAGDRAPAGRRCRHQRHRQRRARATAYCGRRGRLGGGAPPAGCAAAAATVRPPAALLLLRARRARRHAPRCRVVCSPCRGATLQAKCLCESGADVNAPSEYDALTALHRVVGAPARTWFRGSPGPLPLAAPHLHPAVCAQARRGRACLRQD